MSVPQAGTGPSQCRSALSPSRQPPAAGARCAAAGPPDEGGRGRGGGRKAHRPGRSQENLVLRPLLRRSPPGLVLGKGQRATRGAGGGAKRHLRTTPLRCAVRGAGAGIGYPLSAVKRKAQSAKPKPTQSRQDSMATPKNFGGGSRKHTVPDQLFLGITRAPPSPPGRGRAQNPVRRNPNPQATKHEAARGRLRSRGSLIQQSNRNMTLLPVLGSLSLLNFQAPHLIPGRSSPGGSVEGNL
jgi:hypothetical protein